MPQETNLIHHKSARTIHLAKTPKILFFYKNREKNVKIKKQMISSNFSMTKKLGRREWLRGWIVERNKKKILEKFKTTGSGIISSISQSDGIIDIDEDVKYIKKGKKLNFISY